MTSPYSDLPAKAFWKSGVADRAPHDPGDVYTPRFAVTQQDRVMTAGSCFAQHIGRTLKKAEFDVLDMEPPPRHVRPDLAKRYGFGLFTARYGNIYTARHLLQLFDEAHGDAKPADPVWTRDGRFFDAQRPNVEPDGLDDPETVLRLRADHLDRVRKAFASVDVFVFTFGLTEAWEHTASGTVFPTAPGTLAGQFDPDIYGFRNFTHAEVLADFRTFRDRLRAINGGVRFVVTTSPVPLTATASGEHVEVATCYSKAVLRAVCGELYKAHDDVEYFPSYEIITSQRAAARYYAENLRDVAEHGVETAMYVFMNAHGVEMARPDPADAPVAPGDIMQFSPRQLRAALKTKKAQRLARKAAQDAPKEPEDEYEEDETVCEDALLEAFNRS